MPKIVQAALTTRRLTLEPITVDHAEELCEFFNDPELHRFSPTEPLTLESQKIRCERWTSRRSPDGSEIWLNWAARDKLSAKIVAHFQAGIAPDAVATIGYVVGVAHQHKGIATEGLLTVFDHLRDGYNVKEIKALSDTRNVASHRLAQKLGMKQIAVIKDADFFKGAPSDEFVFSKILD